MHACIPQAILLSQFGGNYRLHLPSPPTQPAPISSPSQFRNGLFRNLSPPPDHDLSKKPDEPTDQEGGEGLLSFLMRRVAGPERAERRRQIWTLLERASERGEPPWAIIQFPFVASLGGTGGRVFERVSLLVSGLLLICRTDIIG